MKVITTDSCYVIVDKINNRAIKIVNSYWMKKCPWIIKNEVRALTRLADSIHFPNLISYDENSITTEYAGAVATASKYIKNPTNNLDVREFVEIPDDFEEQVNVILDELGKANLRHSDINGGHFLIKDGIVKLIDFELCLEFGEPEPKNYMQTQGIEAKTRNIDEPIDDRLMAHRTIQRFKGGINKINNLLGTLPNRLQYHELPFNLIQKANRGYLKERIKMFKEVYDFKNKKGLDLGCNIGGITFSLAINGAKMTGVDVKPKSIEIANACEEYYGLNTKFIENNIVDFCLKDTKIRNDMDIEHYDFCVFVATWHWVLKQEGLKKATEVLNKVSEKCDVMFFETNFGHEEGLTGSEETMVEAGLNSEAKLIDFIIKNTKYNKVENIGNCIGWANRPTFMATK